MKTYSIKQVAEAMKKTSTVSCWYDKKEINEPIKFAEKQGWVHRVSVSQVNWNEEGVEALNLK